MIDVERKLPAFALPFVLRSLRRRRGRRYAALSLMLAVATLAVGLWLGLGVGQIEQRFRVATGFELPFDQRQVSEFTVFANDDEELRLLTSAAARLEQAGPCKDGHDGPYTGVDAVAGEGRELLRAAKFQNPVSVAQMQLQGRVLAFMDECPARVWEPFRHVRSIDLGDPADVASIEQVLAARGIPKVERYRSPLDSRAVVRLIGGIASFVLGAILTVFAPLAIAMAQAQERRENTLTPLTGTTLPPGPLALGIASGPAVVAAIYAAPQLVTFAVAVVVTGRIGPSLLVLVTMIGIAVFTSFVAQLLAHRLGRRRTPWAIGIGLLIVLAGAWLVVLAAYDEEQWWSQFGPASTLLPHLAIPELLRWTFAPNDASVPVGIGRALAISLAVELGAAALAIRVLAQELAGHSPQLRRWQAGLGAGLALLAVDSVFTVSFDPGERGFAALYLGCAALLLPFAFLLTTRVPGGDAPAKLRRVPLALLLVEMFVWAAAHVAVVRLWIATTESFEPLSLTWLGWCFVTVGLLAIRLSVRAPTSLAAQAWVVVCALFVLVALVEAIDASYARLDHLSLIAELSPPLGVVELALLVVIPISLVRHLGRSLGAIR